MSHSFDVFIGTGRREESLVEQLAALLGVRPVRKTSGDSHWWQWTEPHATYRLWDTESLSTNRRTARRSRWNDPPRRARRTRRFLVSSHS